MSLIWTIVSFGIQLKFVSVLNDYSLPYCYSNVKEKYVVVDALKFYIQGYFSLLCLCFKIPCLRKPCKMEVSLTGVV